MRAAVFHEPGTPFSIESVDDPTPGTSQVVIAVKRCGICGTHPTRPRVCQQLARVICLVLLAMEATVALATEANVRFARSYVSHDWGQIHVLRSHPVRASQDIPMVCLPPNPYSGNYYRLFMEELGRDRTMLSLDYPGLGQSDVFEGDFSLGTLANVMAESLYELGYGPNGSGPVDLCGYHSGTFVAMELAISHPTLVRKVVMVGIPYFEEPERQELLERLSEIKPWPDAHAATQADWEFAVEKRNKLVTLERAYTNFLESARAWQGKPRIYNAVFRYPAEDRAPLLSHSTLVLNPHADLMEHSRALAALLPNAEVIELPDMQYGIFDVAPKELAARVRPFLKAPQ